MEIQNTQAELDVFVRRVQLEITSKMEDFESRGKAELARLQIYYETQTSELAARKQASLIDQRHGWQSRNWWQD
jgi:hypothetical protein